MGKIKSFEEGLLRTMKEKHVGVMDAIRTEKAISDKTMPLLKAAVEAFTKAFA